MARGNFLALFTERSRFLRYLQCILIGLPTWFVIGILAGRGSSFFAPALGIQGQILSNRVIAVFYTGITLGDLASGVCSQLIKSRRKTVFIFLTYSLAMIVVYFFLISGASSTTFYTVCGFLGFGMGYWAIFVTVAAEQFGTNLRATVATTVPNFARGFLVPLTFLFTELVAANVSVVATGCILTVICFGASYLALWRMEETYGKDLDYLEIQLASQPGAEGTYIGGGRSEVK